MTCYHYTEVFPSDFIPALLCLSIVTRRQGLSVSFSAADLESVIFVSQGLIRCKGKPDYRFKGRKNHSCKASPDICFRLFKKQELWTHSFNFCRLQLSLSGMRKGPDSRSTCISSHPLWASHVLCAFNVRLT